MEEHKQVAEKNEKILVTRVEKNRVSIHKELFFACGYCGYKVPVTVHGSKHRNHCPRCLWSCHVDLTKGDRRSRCKGMMEPISIWVQNNGEWSIIHRCKKCGVIRTNRVAGEDNELALILLVTRPIKQSAFPLNELELYNMIKE